MEGGPGSSIAARFLGRFALGFCLVVLFAGRAVGADLDANGLDDGFERFFGLGTSAERTAPDPDGDGLTSKAEEALWTDPLVGDTDRDGWRDDVDEAPLSRGVMYWGDEQFTTGNLYIYTGPSWWLGGAQSGGQWQSNGWQVGAETAPDAGMLFVEVDPALVSSNLMLDLTLEGGPSAALYADLYDTNLAVVASNLFGNLAAGDGAAALLRLDLPFGVYPNAAGIRLRQGGGEVLVRESVIYVDLDGDGLDASQEAQLGTSDGKSDSDGDGVGDWLEVFGRATDPTRAASVNVTLHANVDTGHAGLDGFSATVEDSVRGPKGSIGDALALAVSGDEIRVAGSTNAYAAGTWSLKNRDVRLVPVGSVVVR